MRENIFVMQKYKLFDAQKKTSFNILIPVKKYDYNCQHDLLRLFLIPIPTDIVMGEYS